MSCLVITLEGGVAGLVDKFHAHLESKKFFPFASGAGSVKGSSFGLATFVSPRNANGSGIDVRLGI